MNLPGVSQAATLLYSKQERLKSGFDSLDTLLDGGLKWGSVIEWGMPLGGHGRSLLGPFIRSATRNSPPLWTLWICSLQGIEFYPLAMSSVGVDLRYLRVAYSAKPLTELKSLLIDDFFRLIIFDGTTLKHEDGLYLQRLAHKNKQIFMIIQSRMLSDSRASLWARLRINLSYNAIEQRMTLDVIKGLSPRQLCIGPGDVCYF